jgi:hypothetical protein
MAVLQMLTEVVGAEEFLGLIAFTKFVHNVQVFGTNIPIRRVGELFAAVTTGISRRPTCRRGMESGMRTRQSGT